MIDGNQPPPKLYLTTGGQYSPTPGVEHVLLSDHNGDPTCACGYKAPGSRTQMAAVSRIQKHIHAGGKVDPENKAEDDATTGVPADPWGAPKHARQHARESITVTRLRAARDKAWPELQPAFDVAIMQAKQADYEAERASTIAMTGHEASYSPLVTALAESVEAPRTFDPWNPQAHL